MMSDFSEINTAKSQINEAKTHQSNKHKLQMLKRGGKMTIVDN